MLFGQEFHFRVTIYQLNIEKANATFSIKRLTEGRDLLDLFSKDDGELCFIFPTLVLFDSFNLVS